MWSGVRGSLWIVSVVNETAACDLSVLMAFPVSLLTDNSFWFQAVTALVKNYPKHMISSMQQILPIVWNTLTESAALYPW